MERTGSSHAPPGHGRDAARHLRPGVPRERRAPDPGAHWRAPAQQPDIGAVVKAGVAPTAVFGTSVPPRWLSGALKRLAYRVPEHRATRWALLLASDRVDVLEHRVSSLAWMLPAALALGLGFALTTRALRRTS
jgi:hypothetical protein